VVVDSEMELLQIVVADLVTIDPIVVTVDAPIEEAAHILQARSIASLPVVDRFGSLVGVIGQADLIDFVDSPARRLARTMPSGLRVGELMTSPAVTVSLSRPFYEAGRLMVDAGAHRLVALDEAGCPQGVLSVMDVVTFLLDG
jgi:CBS-domain-containing membrane protein